MKSKGIDSCQRAVEDDRLPTDDVITSSDNETKQNDVASDQNIGSGSESNDNRTFIVGVSQVLKRYFMQYVICSLVMDWLYLVYVWILQFIYYFSSTAKYVRSWYIAIHVW